MGGRPGLDVSRGAGLLDWLDKARWEIQASKTDIAIRALELYLALEAPADRPAGYELSPEVAKLLAELHELQEPQQKLDPT